MIVSRHPRCTVARRGFLVLDVVAGIVLALFLLIMMTVVTIRQARRERDLAETRAAARSTEAALLALQSGATLPAGARLERLSADPVGSQQWVRVTMTTGSHTSALVGLVNANAAAGGVK